MECESVSSKVEALIHHIKALGLEPESKIDESFYLITGTDRLVKEMYVYAKLSENVFFVAYDSCFSNGGVRNVVYSGIFGILYSKDTFECEVYKKSWYDKLLFGRVRKVGLQSADQKLTISGSRDIPAGFFTDLNVKLFLEANRIFGISSMTVDNEYRSVVDELKGRKVVGFKVNRWIYESEEVEAMIMGPSRKLIEIITKEYLGI